ncbi:DUF6247 family protein [Streptomyces fuscichromogenes]|uniref:DUF6247 family protein n=1 Tax=Streptomyces fuscichromogenes TaxID=1324013 RepID=UPI0038210D20
MTAHATENDRVIPPMPERTPKALRAAITEHAPVLLPDFDEHWKWAIADAYDVGPVHAFMALWWGEYALARDPELDAHVHDLEYRAGNVCTDINEAKALLEEAARIRHRARAVEPGE